MTNQIRAIRRLRKLTQQDVADAMHITQGAVSQWEIGLTMPNVGDLRRLAELLGVTTDALISEIEITPSDPTGPCVKNRIQEIRKARGYTQQTLADALGIERATVGMWEIQHNAPTVEMLIRLADLLNVTTDALLGRADIKTNQPTEKKGERTMITLNDLLTIVDARQLRLVVPVTERLKAQVTVNTRNAGELDDCVRLYGEWPIFSAEPAHEGAVMVIELTKDKGLALTEARG